MAKNEVPVEQIEAIKKKAKEKDETAWKGMHNGTVKGKSFEASRRSRKSHSARAQIASKK